MLDGSSNFYLRLIERFVYIILVYYVSKYMIIIIDNRFLFIIRRTNEYTSCIFSYFFLTKLTLLYKYR